MWKIGGINMSLQQLESETDLQQVLQNEKRFIVLKHSLTCPISSNAKQVFERFADATMTPTYILHIQESRDLSNKIADQFGVKHESPQVLLFEDGSVKWDTSHWDITPDELEKHDVHS